VVGGGVDGVVLGGGGVGAGTGAGVLLLPGGGGALAPVDRMRMSAQLVKNSGLPDAMPHQPGLLP
jgi:hypothetical protein